MWRLSIHQTSDVRQGHSTRDKTNPCVLVVTQKSDTGDFSSGNTRIGLAYLFPFPEPMFRQGTLSYSLFIVFQPRPCTWLAPAVFPNAFNNSGQPAFSLTTPAVSLLVAPSCTWLSLCASFLPAFLDWCFEQRDTRQTALPGIRRINWLVQRQCDRGNDN